MAVIDMTEFDDNALPERLFPIIKKLAISANQNENDDLGIQTALDGVAGANTAITSLGTRMNTVEAGVANAGGRLAGDDNYFEATYSFTGTPAMLVIPSFTSVYKSVGITYTAGNGFFNFSYLGKYLVTAEIVGSCVNTRTDDYQEISTRMRVNAYAPSDQMITFGRLPKSGTWNMAQSGSTLIDVAQGDQWRMILNMTALGSSSGTSTVTVRVKKVV